MSFLSLSRLILGRVSTSAGIGLHKKIQVKEICSALPNFHHTWLSFQTHAALRRLSQQVGSYSTQDPHLDVCACDRVHQLFREHQGLSFCLTQTRSYSFIEIFLADAAAVSDRLHLGMEVYHSSDFIQLLLPCGNLLQDCPTHTWVRNVSLLIHKGFQNELAFVRGDPKVVNRSGHFVLSQTVHFDSQTDCWTSMRCLPGAGVLFLQELVCPPQSQ